MRKVLIVEDYELIHETWEAVRKLINLDVQFVFARSSETAEELYNEHKSEICAVVLDGEVIGGDTVDLAKTIRAGREDLPIIAMSGNDSIQERLKAAGCNHALDSKSHLCQFLKELLG